MLKITFSVRVSARRPARWVVINVPSISHNNSFRFKTYIPMIE